MSHSSQDQFEPHSHPDGDHPDGPIEKLMTISVAAAKGIVPEGQIVIVLLQIANGTEAPPEIRDFAQVLIQIVRGNRDSEVGVHLPPHLAEAVRETIERIEAPLQEPPPEDVETEGLTLIELLERVGEACQGNIAVWQQLWQFTESLEAAETTPTDIKELAVVLRKILAGERQLQVTANLPAELAGPVNALITQLVEQAPNPPT